MPPFASVEEETPRVANGTEPTDSSSACKKRRNFIVNCTFMNACTDFMCTFTVVLWIFIALGVVLGVIVMPIYLSKATTNTVTDDCVIEQCDGYVVKVRLVGFQRDNVSVHTSSPCTYLVGETRRCFVKLGTVNGSMDVSFGRRDLVLGVTFGLVGWAVLVPLFAWACLVMSRNTAVREDGYRNEAFLSSFWIIIGLLIAYGVAAGVVALPVVATGGWRYAKEQPVKDVCLVQSCSAQNFGAVVAQTSKRESVVYVRDCALHVRKTITCYVTPSPGLIVTYKPYKWVVIGLASSAWMVNAGFLVWMVVAIFGCLCDDLDRAIREQSI